MSDGVAIYIKGWSDALRGSAHQFFFPFDKEKRRQRNLRLAREFGYGLADSPIGEVDREIGSAYGQLIAMFSFDTTGNQIDAKEFVTEARRAEADERLRRQEIAALAHVRIPSDGYSDAETIFVEPVQHVARHVCPGARVRVLWATFDGLGYGGDSEVVAVRRKEDGTDSVWTLTLPFSDDDDDKAFVRGQLLRLDLEDVHTGLAPAFVVSAKDVGRAHEDCFNICYPQKRRRHD